MEAATIQRRNRSAARQQRFRADKRRIDYQPCEPVAAILAAAKADRRWPKKNSELIDAIILEWASMSAKKLSKPRLEPVGREEWLLSLDAALAESR